MTLRECSECFLTDRNSSKWEQAYFIFVDNYKVRQIFSIPWRQTESNLKHFKLFGWRLVKRPEQPLVSLWGLMKTWCSCLSKLSVSVSVTVFNIRLYIKKSVSTSSHCTNILDTGGAKVEDRNRLWEHLICLVWPTSHLLTRRRLHFSPDESCAAASAHIPEDAYIPNIHVPWPPESTGILHAAARLCPHTPSVDVESSPVWLFTAAFKASETHVCFIN